ncbi:tRNA lysidine(34) synthetase TilS [Spirosoma sordidisoli]|uniref:tRNA(Ile)-lysidine synthase n=1 Tax=Spirosoma sordidisoli TaxID=2502893 RepID=A0A4Q2UR32_9BACT|nr:tRNA lysidine(34) synthetase TilS [Spirosoma sordidisoli]RYC70281.1 tRNA lysidine(34) synthetase TilS [Spirosoma sordidisoli]
MFRERFLKFINENKLIAPPNAVLLAVSGGLDSMVMAHLFHQSGLPFAVAHVNFGLRGAESDADAAFVENSAQAYGVPFHLTRVDTATIAAGRGMSIQMAARDLRYSWFTELVRQHGYTAVATAHHQNDVLETILLNLTRGTGLAGLRGILPRQGEVIRPLLFATRDELAAYAHEASTPYREDSSNADDKYARNRIRHRVVPVLTELNPALLTETLPRSLEKLRAADRLLEHQLAQSWQAVAEQQAGRIWLPAHKLIDVRESAFQLGEWLSSYGFRADQVNAMLACLSQATGQVFQSASHRVVHDRLASGQTGLSLEPLSQLDEYAIILHDWPVAPIEVAEQFELVVELVERTDGFSIPADPSVACLDADQLRFPLTVRPWHLGDRIQPLGMKGTKLISDLLNSNKLPRLERERIAVLVSDSEIAWVIGHRISHRFRITEQTRRIAQFNWRQK